MSKSSQEPPAAVARMYERGPRRAALATLGRLALGGVGLQQLLDEAVRLVQTTLSADYVKFLEYMPGEACFLLRAGAGWKEGLVGHASVPTGGGSQAGYTFSVRRPVIVEDLRTEERFRGPQLLLDHGVTSGLSVVIGRRRAPWGVLGVHTRAKREFTQEDADFVQAVAHVVGGAVSRRRVRRQLRRTEERLRLSEEASGIGSWDWNLLTNQPIWSDELFRIYGWDPSSQASYERWTNAIHPEDREQVKEAVQEAIDNKRSFACDFRFIRGDGQLRWLTGKGKVYYENGLPVRMLGINMDITDQRQRLESLRLREQLYSRALAELEVIYDNTPAGLCVFDRELRVLRLNDAMAKMGALPPGDYAGRPVAGLLPYLTNAISVHDLAVAQAGATTLRREITFRDSQRRARCWLVSWVPVYDADERLDFVTCVVLDITERKQAEKVLARDQKKLEKLVQERTSELVGANKAIEQSRQELRTLARRLTAIHEDRLRQLSQELHGTFGQQLAAIAMQVGLLTKSVSEPTAEFAAGAKRARLEIERLSRDIHELSRQLHPTILEDLGLAPALRELCEIVSNSHGIQATLTDDRKEDRALPRPVGLCLYRVVQECLSNAAKHSGAEEVAVRLTTPKAGVVLTVQGEFNLAAPESADGAGFPGLQERVQQLGGKIAIERMAGEGTRVKVRIPLLEGGAHE